jgi:hypothetical protein
MRILIILIPLISICIIESYSYDIEIIEPGLTNQEMSDMVFTKNRKVILSIKSDIPGRFMLGSVAYEENGIWTVLPDSIEHGIGTTFLLTSLESMINIDSNGGIWVSGMYLYQYKNNEWKYFYIDDEYWLDRIYGPFCIDKYDNIWATSYVYKKTSDTIIEFSELHKFNGTDFIPVFKFTSQYSFRRFGRDIKANCISALPDGRIALQRNFNKPTEDLDSGTDDLYLINQDLIHSRMKLQTPSGPDYNEWNHTVASIYPETANKIWFCLELRTIGIEELSSCCSGLELYEKSNWMAMDTINGFELVIENESNYYKPIFRILPFDNNYLLIGKDKLYLMGADHRIYKKITWIDILNSKCKFTISNPGIDNDWVDNFFLSFIDPDKYPRPMSLMSAYIKNDKVIMQFGKGILEFGLDILTDVADIRSEDYKSISISPIPATTFLRIGGVPIKTEYQIINTLGEICIEGCLESNEINISHLNQGLFFIMFKEINNSSSLKFIKINN